MSGLFGVVSSDDCASDLFYGVDYHSHMGTEYSGLAVYGSKFWRKIHTINQSQFKSKFFDEYASASGRCGIGVISDNDAQPLYMHSKFGPFAIATCGLIENKEELASCLLKQGVSFSEETDGKINATELVAKLINQGDSLIDGIEKMFEVIKGSCSFLILKNEGIYAARDRFGYTPLVIGKKSGALAAASESASFANLGYDIVKYMDPGEIVLLSQDGIKEQKKGCCDSRVCAFLWIYTGFPASNYEGINVELVRERCGRFLARRDSELFADFVSGVPDSGVAHALGYAMEKKIPYRQPLVKYTPGYGRSYTPPSQQTRNLIAKMKLIPIREIIDGYSIVICEDSIVRGTQLKSFTLKKLWSCGARHVHVRSACPPLLFPCKFCLSTRSIDELAARRAIRDIEGKDVYDVSDYLDPESVKYRKMVDWISKDIEATSLRFQHMEDMIQAIGLAKNKLCLYCWEGEREGEL